MKKWIVCSLTLSLVVLGACQKKEEAPKAETAIESMGADLKKSAEATTTEVKEVTAEAKAELEKQAEALKDQKAPAAQ